jgi:hypothetical protein
MPVNRTSPSGGRRIKGLNGHVNGHTNGHVNGHAGRVVKDVPIATMATERIAAGRSVYDLYHTVDAMIARFQELAVETLGVLTKQNGKNGSHAMQVLPSSAERIQRANMKLFAIAKQMRLLATSLDGLLSDDGNFKGEVLSICFTISNVECILEVRLGKSRKASAMANQCGIDFVINGASLYDDTDGAFPLKASAEDYRQLLHSLSSCRLPLRDSIARALRQSAMC